MKKIKLTKVDITLTLIIISITLLMYFFPLLHDDLLHGSIPLGFNFMPHVNGRYLGNFFSINLAAHSILRVFIKSFVIILILHLVKKLFNNRNNLFLLLFVSLFLFMPKEMFRETMPFTAGFSNYILPAVGILFIMDLHLNNRIDNNKLFHKILLLIVGLFNSLFVEHITHL